MQNFFFGIVHSDWLWVDAEKKIEKTTSVFFIRFWLNLVWEWLILGQKPTTANTIIILWILSHSESIEVFWMGCSTVPAHIKSSAIFIIIQTLWFVSSWRELPFVVMIHSCYFERKKIGHVCCLCISPSSHFLGDIK